MRNLNEVIVRPIITEKSHELLDQQGAYSFVVDKAANKIEIKQAVETLFNVKVKDVRTMNYTGKYKRMGRFIGKKINWKKAVVTLQAGDSIELFEGV
jgi:large subunit ribosomal protein L23